ncbi:DUF2127 domain-containing protein [Rhodanobacter sp. C01]|uniref:DUF2127 domain-containing protein n=1 Tax=Rhodanobacter sp. C01 TaxID=1945856 RepID=UPI0009CD5080|nr:DUF2127 domain-containing protein [Rhodanobacter sp. C01]OOG47870.1 hypothetical protein B0E50_10555 [Rhodanobacter sp. C01]
MPSTTTSTSRIEPPAKSTRTHAVGLRAIAIYKGAKSVGLLLVAIAAFHLDHQQNFERMVHWLEHLSLADSNQLRWRLVDLLTAMGPRKFVAVGIVALAYAALFAIEGTGLWLRMRWAQWFTALVTGSLVPLELYEVMLRFSGIRLVVLATNIAVVIYLLYSVLQSGATTPETD